MYVKVVVVNENFTPSHQRCKIVCTNATLCQHWHLYRGDCTDNDQMSLILSSCFIETVPPFMLLTHPS